MAKKFVPVELGKDELMYICRDCGNFYKSMKAMDKHLVAKHSLPVYVYVSRSIN